MVHITKIKTNQSNDGKTFTSFVLEGGVELVQSNSTGKFYAKGKKALLSTTLSEEAAQQMVGSKLPGSIQRVASEPYEYTIKETGETVTLFHSYAYSPNEDEVTVTNSVQPAFVEIAEVIA